MSNTLSYVVLFMFPLVAVILFNRLGAIRGLIWTILAGYLFLPVRPVIDLPVPGLPYIDKAFVPALSALILIGVATRKELRLARIAERRAESKRGTAEPKAPKDDKVEAPSKGRGRWVVNLLLVLAILGPVLTTMTNGEPLFRGDRIQRGFQLYDSGRAVVTALVMLMPFLLARKYLATAEAHRALIWALVVAGLAYMCLSLYEVRMSPTLNRKLYGFFAHEWRQHVRRDGYRPILFLEHGLRVAIFLAMGIIAVAVAARMPEHAKSRKRLVWGVLPLIVALWMVKSLGAFMIICMILPVALFAAPRAQVMIAAVLSAIILFYPMVRGTGLVPIAPVVSLAGVIEKQRADSLEFRLENEEILLKRAAQKPIAGWGGYGRWLILDDKGRKESIPDGRWVITIGQFGWLGYLTEFGLLTIAILMIAFRRRSLEIGVATAGLVLILTANLIDLIPNSGLTPVTWLLAGSLAGWYEKQRAAVQAPQPVGGRKPAVARRSAVQARRAGAT